MQSFQTRLRTGPMGFDIITHVSACRGNRCFSFNLVNHFALVPIEQAPLENPIMASEAKRDYVRDLRMAMTSVNIDDRFMVPETPEFQADAFYSDIADQYIIQAVPRSIYSSTTKTSAAPGNDGFNFFRS